MRLKPCLASLLIAALALPALAADEKNDRRLGTHQVPKDPQAAVITLDFVGGFGPPRKNNEPNFVIRADGTAILGDPWGTQKRIETKLPEGTLQELLRFALDRNKFFELESAGLAKAVQEDQKGGLQIAVADAATTVIKIHADGKEHEVKYYALGMIARQHPKVKGLTQLWEIEQRLGRVRSEINAGGPAGVAKFLKLANQKLKADHPNVVRLTAEHLQGAWRRADGTIGVTFQRQTEANGKVTFTFAQIQQPAEGEPKVTANVTERAATNVKIR